MHGDMASELYNLRILGTAQFKGVAVFQPVVGNLHLITVLNLLLEHAVTVTDTTAVCRVSQGCKRVQEAGSQSPQSAVSQRSIRLLIFHGVQIQPQLLQCFLYRCIRL